LASVSKDGAAMARHRPRLEGRGRAVYIGGTPSSRPGGRGPLQPRNKTMSGTNRIGFAKRLTVEQVEEGDELAPKFDEHGLIPVVTTDYDSGEVLMHGYMNEEALRRTIETGEAHYWSRSRQALWRKGATSGLIQHLVEMRIDDDQDAVWLRVKVDGGASCHVGYRSCFFRSVPFGEEQPGGTVKLGFEETEKVFDPHAVYGDAPNPTKL
jgi:phosphoribosyl-AMP cyclohydrolase